MEATVAASDADHKDVVILERESQLDGISMQRIHNVFGLHKLGRESTGPEYTDVYAKSVQERDIMVYTETMVTSISPEKVIPTKDAAVC